MRMVLPARNRTVAGIALASVASLSATAARAHAQVLNFRHYTGAEGLPQSQVLGIYQDRQGYLWFATYGGLTRFNGLDFHTYTRQDGLASNAAYDVTADERGRLLIGTSRGVCIMDHERFACRGQRDGLVSDNMRSVRSDGAGGIWASSAAGVSHIAAGGRIRNYTTADGLPPGRAGRLVVDAAGTAWVATERGLARFEHDRFVVDSAAPVGAASVEFVAWAGDRLLFGSRNRLFIRKGGVTTQVATGPLPDSARFTDGTIAPGGTIWASLRSGVLRVADGNTDLLTERNGLLSSLVNRVFIDREHDVWFGTERGASEHAPGPFRTYTEAEGLPSPFVRAIASDANGTLWLGTRAGVAVRDGDRFRAVPLPKVQDNRVYSLAREPGRDGRMLVGTSHGLFVYRAGDVRALHEADGLPGEVVYGLAADSTGVWVATERGLARWEHGRLTKVDRPGLAGLNIMSIARDRRGRLWLGRLSGGIIVVDGDSIRSLNAAQGATDQVVWSMREDDQGRIWAATNGDGALRIDDAGIKHFTMADGLASNFVWQVLLDSRHNVWMFGNLGLDRLSGDQLRHYGRGAGLLELEGAANSAFEDRDGNLWFGTGSGVVRFNPGLDAEPSVAPSVYVEEASDDGVPFALASTRGVRLDRGVVRIRFAAPTFRDQSVVRYRYRLVGANSAWSTPMTENTITYAGLGPGDYRFEVMAMKGALRSAAPAVIAFTISPAFWQTWWFIGLGVVLFAAVAAAVPVLRARSLERERRRLEGLVAQHTKELAHQNARLAQSNRDLEHFAYVASHDLQEPLRKIQAFSDRITKVYAPKLDDQGRDYLARVGGAAARMQRLIDDLLSLSRVTTKRNPMETIELNPLLDDVLSDLDFRIQSTHGQVEVGVLPRVAGDPVQFRQVFQNLIGNALKFHRPDERPLVRVLATDIGDGMVEIRVSDNGIGFDTKDAERVFLPFHRLHGRGLYEGTGIGLTICQKIIDRHGGAIRAESQPDVGTTFIITLPTLGPIGARHAA